MFLKGSRLEHYLLYAIVTGIFVCFVVPLFKTQ